MNTVDLVIFARFSFSRILRGGQICVFKNLAKTIIIIALLSSKLIIYEFYTSRTV